ncbi:MFS transporter [Arthrobacter globiformis]|uniref:MFS transporter n=1 Tax=Arthrobacter globiformis TaxID=1665 RepID=UPI00277E8E4D|nr:MFS transporter [Arthrobacter globiformis]MDQ0864610.1 MHS family proline/betaine transporter-like MFS transporter [Arthrobacter globiformis]
MQSATTLTTATELSPATRRRTALAVGIGNFMEWFDFAVYGFFASIIGKLFFPESTPILSLLSAFAVFAVGFIMRPLGAFILGPIGDKHGRKAALVWSVLLMGGATTVMGLLPTYAVAGLLAPILLVLLRCVQGIAAGGEWSGSAAYLVESAPNNRRGLYASLISGTAALAFIVGSFVALGLSSALSPEDLSGWGWRLPFLLAAPMSLAGLYIRMKLGDTPVFEGLKSEERVADSPLAKAGTKGLKPIIITFAFSSVSGLGIYYLATYMNNHLTTSLGLDRASALTLSGAGLFIYLLMCPLAGILSDRFGRRSLNIIGTVGFVVLAIPSFILMGTGNGFAIVAGLILFGACQALCSVTNVVLLVELFPASTRSSGSALGYNLGLALVAGPGPLIAAALASSTGTSASAAWYMAVIALIATPILIKWLPETFKRDIHAG